jgi:hypothetical protein
MEYDRKSCGCRVSFVVLDSDWGSLGEFNEIEYEPDRQDGKKYAEQSLHNMQLLSVMVRKLGDRNDP